MITFNFLLLTATLLIKGSSHYSMNVWVAKANLHIDSSSVSIGTITFIQKDIPLAPVRVTGTLKNLTPNTKYHGFHVHMLSLPDNEWNCAGAGAHWNPYDTKHGNRFDSIGHRHVGDLGNIWSDSAGNIEIDFEDSIIQLHNLTKSSILNKSIVIHQDEDDLGLGFHSDSHTTGHAGARIACGNIRLVDSVSASNAFINILWPFDLNTHDAYNVYNGIQANNPTYVPSPASTTAIHFQSSLKQSVLVTQSIFKLSDSSFTVESWIHPTKLSGYDNAILAQCSKPSPENCLHLGIRNAALYMNYYEENLTGNTALKVNNWYHVAFVFDSVALELSIYLNGKQDATKKISKSYPGTNCMATIGTSNISRTHQTHFDGSMDQLSFVSLAKNAGDIFIDATSIPSNSIDESTRDPKDAMNSLSSKNCHSQMEIVELHAKSIKQQADLIAAMWKERRNSTNLSNQMADDSEVPNKIWCPWKGDCTQFLNQRGQVTLEMDQSTSLPFELHMSISEDSTNKTYAIHFSINKYSATIYKTKHGVITTINSTTDEDFILHDGDGKYWLSIDYANRFVKYGQGEARDRCTLIRSDFPEDEKDFLRKIQYAHISFNKSRNVAELKRFEKDVRLKIGNKPVVSDPALLVVSPEDSSIDSVQHHTAISIQRLNENCRELYNDVIKWEFQDDEFPHLYEAIEHSIKSETGWCRKRLTEKANRFGKPTPLATYLRITVGKNRGTSPGVPYVLEIWPSGHYSPIHSHANTYGIIRVLYGNINVKLYRTLNLKKTKPIHETEIFEGQVTWLSPGLNQIHKLENRSSNKSCITIQAYQYGTAETSNYEYFDYIDNDGKFIKQFDPLSDMDYFDFKKLMMEEWKKTH
ncbi:unnamed protein product [Rotaria socialis]|uniref:cysteine dioxygenase n=1 Tax=Rotaria socialis TaxID=392032 RepID=A0A818QF69_9BILA|nr:unnamed protein product [Rotaria socialis]CAF3635650.1 unnamed protein product [Rotaria socialis]CAF3719937.1 unnamed protein product [Rotaria socialis]CAF4509082.1 unnamed protein product [Rotaria socialis]CAF4848913.1 unnamed protein product [Rotaria socialis]